MINSYWHTEYSYDGNVKFLKHLWKHNKQLNQISKTNVQFNSTFNEHGWITGTLLS